MMYKIIADSGSTKTDWVIIDSNKNILHEIKTIGFNPYFQSTEVIFTEIQKVFNSCKIDSNQVAEIAYYGSGCSNSNKKLIVLNALKPIFSNAKIIINHDLIAAAHSTLGSSDGIACIIGTGANSCTWEGEKEVKNIASHGYIFGDEGSGSYLGIKLLKLYLSGRMSSEIRKSFDEEYNLSVDEILNKTYHEKSPNVFLASFAQFYSNKLHDPQLKQIIFDGFDDFFETRILPYSNYKDYPLGFVGSIAYYYQDILIEVAKKHNMEIKKIIKSPIDQLTQYHLGIKF